MLITISHKNIFPKETIRYFARSLFNVKTVQDLSSIYLDLSVLWFPSAHSMKFTF